MKATEIPARIKHLGAGAHPQTPAARRACRKPGSPPSPPPRPPRRPMPVEYHGGETFEVDGAEVILCKSGFNRRTRWTWSPRSCRSAARPARTPPRPPSPTRTACSAAAAPGGQPATLTTSTGPACVNCYDRKAA